MHKPSSFSADLYQQDELNVVDGKERKKSRRAKILRNREHVNIKSMTGNITKDSQVEDCDNLFENIVGYDDVKKIFNYALNSSLPVHILLVGPPGSAKTLFLTE